MRVVRALFRWSTAFVVMLVITPVAAVGIVLGSLIFLPLPATLPQPSPTLESRISHVYDVDGNEIAVYREFETSIPVQPADIPQVLKDAVVTAEDRNFYNHGGVDVRGTMRALLADLRGDPVLQGGSTITQQYVRNAFTEIGKQRTVDRKIREAILANQVDREWDKEEILFRYLSTIYLGEGAYGVGAASETYFRKPVSQLTLSEAALLAGVIPAPSRYSPRVDAAAAEFKRQTVLDSMLSTGKITPEQHAAAKAQAVWLVATQGPPPDPNAVTVVWPPVQQQSQQPWFTDYLTRWLEAHLPGGRDQLYRGGLQIYTTLDPRAQAEAEKAVHQTVDGTDPDLQMALVSVEPPTGYVRAIVGGRDRAASQVNTALGALGGGTGRQPGSSFKPFVLATAFEQGMQPTKTYSGAPHKVGGKVIENYGGGSYGAMNLRTATLKSVNTVFTRLILDVGVEQTMQTAQKLGVDMPPFDPGKYGASVAIGAVEVSPLQMASAFGVFGNQGRRAEPTPITQVLAADGSVVLDYTHAAEKAAQVLPEAVASNVTDLLKGVLGEGGTAAGRGLDRPAAGKTGTSQDNANAWFVGYTPTLSTAVWLGYQSSNKPLRRIKGVGEVTGGSIPAATWQRYMKAVLADVPVTDFSEPAPIEVIADQKKEQARRGFSLGRKQAPTKTPAGGPYVVDSLNPPTAQAPEQTTTTTEPPSTTTSTSTTSTTLATTTTTRR